MSIYERPDLSKSSYASKFVRVGDIIAVTDPGDTKTSHKSLAEKDGLLGELKRLKRESPDNVDGGTVIFSHSSPQSPYIVLNGTSLTLNIPRDEKARQRTMKLFSAITPGCSIRNIHKFIE